MSQKKPIMYLGVGQKLCGFKAVWARYHCQEFRVECMNENFLKIIKNKIKMDFFNGVKDKYWNS